MRERRRDWSDDEVRAIVGDYLEMLAAEAAGQPYTKAVHRSALRQQLDGRSESSIEYKHRNISFVLRELGHHYISGYKPLEHHQAALRTEVERQLERRARTSGPST